jgi:transcriptional regulator with XRE-family HTH domain
MRLTEKTAVYCKLLARELTRRRIIARLSMNSLAEKSGLSQPMIGFIEKGTSVPTAASLYRIAQALGCPTGEIFKQVDADFEKCAGATVPDIGPRANAAGKVARQRVGVVARSNSEKRGTGRKPKG